MHAVPRADGGSVARSSGGNVTCVHQQGGPSDAGCAMAQRFGPPQSGQHDARLALRRSAAMA